MSTIFARVGVITALLSVASMAFGSAETLATPTQSTTIAQASPAPTPTPKPKFVIRGAIRAYDFTRQNASNSSQDKANSQINQQSFNLGIAPHVEYNINDNWMLGGTYYYMNPLNGCQTLASFNTAPCKVVVPAGQLPSGNELNVDNTLPAYQLSALNELFVQYRDKAFFAKLGDQELNTPWAGPNGGVIGSRIMPSSYQALDTTYKINGNWNVEFADSWKYLPRTQEDFTSTTIITQLPPAVSQGFGALGGNIEDTAGTNITTPGFSYGRVGYTSKNFTSNLHLYDVYNITTIGWLDAKYSDATAPLKPYLQFQGGVENSTGFAAAGKIDSSLVGLQGGVNIMPNIVLQLAGDYVPTKTDTLVLPSGFSCSSSNHTISSPSGNKGNLPYFLPNGGTPDCNTVGGVTTLTYGGWASPYSDGYATDPIFTTSLTQGMTDRRAPGSSYMVKLIGTSDDKHLVSYISYAGYDYNQSFMAGPTTEFNFDTTYYVNKPAKAGQYYKGFIFRYRYGEREQPFTSAALPLFKYNRFEGEYDF